MAATTGTLPFSRRSNMAWPWRLSASNSSADLAAAWEQKGERWQLLVEPHITHIQEGRRAMAAYQHLDVSTSNEGAWFARDDDSSLDGL